MEKIRLIIREELQTKPIEVTTSSSDDAAEKNLNLIQADVDDEIEKHTISEKGNRMGSK